MTRPTTRYLATLRRWFGLSPTQPAPKFVGATERFGAELRQLREAPVSPELISDIETELAWGVIWHEFEHSLQAEIERVFAPVLAELNRPRSFDELRELVFPEALFEDTAEWAVVA